MEEKIKLILANVGFADKYINICNAYSQFDNGMNFKKKEVFDAIHACNTVLKYSAPDKSFYEDYDFNANRVRFAMTYKYGFLECFYNVRNDENHQRVMGRFNSIAALQDIDFRSKVAHNFPVATSPEDLKSIVFSLLDLHSAVIQEMEKVLK